ncbi:response regulator transcription factor [Pseudomonas sp. GD03860]|uniref:response regulator transcription factor n=1 Tax=Pseudomonas TaxID=286 RepID=UPI002364961A|nr:MULTISPECIES: response regulator transcription factor [Pseudomonas]MDD2058618.1 response regulator transcription factor [Pseudomonas putida]MDH0640807.1 response regulator transcription factor [Pseudomonas sp. GD03860]
MYAKRLIRIMILDDHPVVLHGIELILGSEPDLQVVGVFSSSQHMMAALHKQEVDLILMDYLLGPDEIDGLNLMRGLRVRYPNVRLLVMSALHTPAVVALVMRRGAHGFVGKDLDTARLPEAIRKVAGGKIYLHEAMAEQLRENQGTVPAGPATVENAEAADVNRLTQNCELTAREHDVLRCCLDGMSVTQIAAKFSRSVKTISTQKQAAFKKLGLRSDNELYKVRYLLEGR